MNVPFPFLPNAKPRNLKFRIAYTLVTLLFFLLTVSFSLFSKYEVLVSNSRLGRSLALCKQYDVVSIPHTGYTSPFEFLVEFVQIDVSK